MRADTPSPRSFRFGPFEVDLDAREVRKHGTRLRVQDQPLQILGALVERPGEVVTREELARRLWPDGTFVDFDKGLNAAITRLRQALSDSAEHPRYVETVARRGYRLMVPLERSAPEVVEGEPVTPAAPAGRRSGYWWKWAFAACLLAVVPAGAWWVLNGLKPKPALRWARVTADAGLTTDPAISPDGTLLAYSSDRAGGSGLDIWVQQLAHGGPAIRVTSGAADEHEPSFSPDGSRIVFRSELNGGGIYIVAALGGEPALLAPLGRGPRFSPDGSSVVFWKGSYVGSTLGAGVGLKSLFIVPANGGPERELQTGLAEAANPVWSPDGSQLLFFGSHARFGHLPLGPAKVSADWWILPLAGGKAAATGAFSKFAEVGLATSSSRLEIPRPGYWTNQGVTFSARSGDTVNLWRIPISMRDRRVNGAAERLTSGTDLETYPSQSRDGQLVFAGMSLRVNLWMLPMDVNEGRATGEMRRITEGVVLDGHPSLCADGSRVVFNSTRPGSDKAGIWIRDLGTGRETLLVPGDAEPFHPQSSSDCSRVAYTQSDGDYVVSSAGGPPERFCSDCNMIWDWSRDGKRMLLSRKGELQAIHLFNLSTKHDRIVLNNADNPLFQARFSPDEQWVAMLRGGRGVWIGRVRDGVAAEHEWFPVTEDNVQADKPRWSADGNILYYTSDRDGFNCLWAQRLNAITRHPSGPPVAVYHFHSSRLSLANVGPGEQEISIGKDMILLNLGELTGNIWASRE